ncbi:MAG: hypothetical protein GY919_18130 [Photobacterium aquimaris]|nr:hypothetical protein [Photobacterium aquimaris]
MHSAHYKMDAANALATVDPTVTNVDRFIDIASFRTATDHIMVHGVAAKG